MKVWAIVALCLVPGAAWGQTAAFKCPKPGTVVEFADGGQTVWQAAGSNYCQLQTRQQNGNTQTSHWFAPTLSMRDTGASGYGNQLKPWTLWPLSVGKKLSGRYDGAGNTPGFQGSWLNEVTVDGFEKITTKAGTFDVFVVTKKEEALSHQYKSTWRQWYAPELGVSVKFTFSDNQGTNRASEAVAIRQ